MELFGYDAYIFLGGLICFYLAIVIAAVAAVTIVIKGVIWLWRRFPE
jgi:hypothetical protein